MFENSETFFNQCIEKLGETKKFKYIGINENEVKLELADDFKWQDCYNELRILNIFFSNNSTPILVFPVHGNKHFIVFGDEESGVITFERFSDFYPRSIYSSDVPNFISDLQTIVNTFNIS